VAAESLTQKWVKAVALSTAAAAAIYLASVLWVGREQVGAALKMVSGEVLCALLGLSLLNYALRFLRWHYYLRRMGAQIGVRADLGIYIGGFALTTTPGKAGEMARSLWLKPLGVPASVSLAAFLAERVQDFLAIVLLSSLGAFLYPGGIWLLMLSVALVVASMLAIYVPAASAGVLGVFERRGGFLGTFARRAAEVLSLTRGCLSARRFGLGLVLGTAAWTAEAAAFWLLLQALGLPPSALTAVAIYAFSMLAGAVSFMPGGLGGSEASMVLLLTLCRVPLAAAVSATLLIRLTTLWFAVLLGIVALSLRIKPPRAVPGSADPRADPEASQ
jgi:uncharacterized protein (TIRG00374 family)